MRVAVLRLSSNRSLSRSLRNLWRSSSLLLRRVLRTSSSSYSPRPYGCRSFCLSSASCALLTQIRLLGLRSRRRYSLRSRCRAIPVARRLLWKRCSQACISPVARIPGTSASFRAVHVPGTPMRSRLSAGACTTSCGYVPVGDAHSRAISMRSTLA